MKASDTSALVFPAAGFTAQQVVSCIHAHGVALLKGVLPVEPLVKVRKTLTAHFDMLTTDATKHDDGAKRLDWCILNGVSGPNLPEDLTRVVETVGSSRIAECIREYLRDDECVVPINHLLFRLRDHRTVPAVAPYGLDHWFHQDHDHIPGQFPMNVWAPLSIVDTRCLGLSFVFPYGTTIYKEPFSVGDYLAKNDGFVWSPDLAPGDVLLFHRSTIHGAFADWTKKTPRFSVEFRVGRSCDTPAAYKDAVVPIGRRTWFEKMCQPVVRLFRKSA